MKNQDKKLALIRLRDAATGEDKTALRWAVNLAEYEERREIKRSDRMAAARRGSDASQD